MAGRPGKLVKAFGMELTIKEWVEQMGIGLEPHTIKLRLLRGVSPEDAVIYPKGELPKKPRKKKQKEPKQDVIIEETSSSPAEPEKKPDNEWFKKLLEESNGKLLSDM